MDSKDTEILRTMLVEEKARLEEELADIMGGNHEQAGTSDESSHRTQMADSGSDTLERQRDLSLEENVKHLLGRVNVALQRVEKGSYGLCDCCGGEIGAERLKALPYADKCIECKRKEEAW